MAHTDNLKVGCVCDVFGSTSELKGPEANSIVEQASGMGEEEEETEEAMIPARRPIALNYIVGLVCDVDVRS